MLSHEDGLKALGLLYRWLDWRYGPEGPEILFEEGVKLIRDTQEYVKWAAGGRDYQYSKEKIYVQKVTTDG